MLFAVVAQDRPGALEIRKANRANHLEYIKSSGVVRQAGPFLDKDGEMCGSLLILDVDTLEAAENWAIKDPYALADLFVSDSVQARNWVFST